MNKLIINTEAARERAINILQGLELSRPMQVTIDKYVKKRSLSQNRLYHKWVDILGNHFGYEVEEMKEELKSAFLPAEGRITKPGLNGEGREFHTTTKLTTEQFTLYLEAIDRFAASHGVILPHPEDVQRNW